MRLLGFVFSCGAVAEQSETSGTVTVTARPALTLTRKSPVVKIGTRAEQKDNRRSETDVLGVNQSVGEAASQSGGVLTGWLQAEC